MDYIILSLTILAIGIIGLVTKHDLIKMLIAVPCRDHLSKIEDSRCQRAIGAERVTMQEENQMLEEK